MDRPIGRMITRAVPKAHRGLLDMSSWGVQLVIGRLLTDAAFRQRFETSAHESLMRLYEQGIELTACEVAAFLDTDREVWSTTARQIDARLRTDRPSPLAWAAVQDLRDSLTARERQVLRGIFQGLTNKQIGFDIGVSESAVKGTLQHLFRKTRVRTRAQLVRAVVEGSLGPVTGQGQQMLT
jgi:DNA-binding NarL/FixJ family response regulator